jgi:hypothetical protein
LAIGNALIIEAKSEKYLKKKHLMASNFKAIFLFFKKARNLKKVSKNLNLTKKITQKKSISKKLS